MKKNSSFKLRSGNKPSIAKFMGLKDVIGNKAFQYGAINMLANLFGKGKDNKKNEIEQFSVRQSLPNVKRPVSNYPKDEKKDL